MAIIKVKTGGITADAITSTEIADNAVVTAAINADAVTDAKIADDVVGTEHLTANEVDTAALKADAVTAAQIADDAISEEHLDVTAITGHTAETSVADGDLVVVHDASASALRKMTVANLVANAGGGKVLQVVATNKTDVYSEATNASTFTGLVTGLTVAITPSASNSKVLLIINGAFGMSAVGAISFAVFRDSTQIDLGDAASNRGRTSKGMIYNGEYQYMAMISTIHLDSPSTTSQITYGVKLGHTSGSSKTMYCNRDHTYTDSAFRYPTSSSNIIAIEIGA